MAFTGLPRLRDAAALPPQEGPMCAKCKEINLKLNLAKRMWRSGFDAVTDARIVQLVEAYECQLVVLRATAGHTD